MPVVTKAQIEKLKEIRLDITEILLDIDEHKFDFLNIDVVTDYACEHFNIYKDDLLGKNRKAEIVQARIFIAKFCRKELKMSTTELAKYFDKEHSNFVTLCKRLDENMTVDRGLKREYIEFIANLI